MHVFPILLLLKGAAIVLKCYQRESGTLTPNGSFSMGMIQKVGTSFNHVGGFQ